MIYNVYSVRDSKSDFHVPFVDVNDASASRSFAMTVNTPGNLISFAPSDFALYCVGTFNSESGALVSDSLPRFVVSASSLLSVKEL